MTDNDILATLAAQRTRLLESKEQIDQALDENKAQILDATDGPGKYLTGNITVEVRRTRRFDVHLAEKILPADVLDAIRVSVITPAVAKEVLPPALYQQCMRELDSSSVVLR